MGTPLPVVLVVEDRHESLRRRLELFETFGCSTLGAESLAQALDHIRQTPHIDLVVTDINLGSGIDDKSGIALATLIRRQLPGVAIAAYSAYFGEDDLDLNDSGLFDLAFTKVGSRSASLERQILACVTLAREAQENRIGLRTSPVLHAEYAVDTAPMSSLVYNSRPPQAVANLVQAMYAIRIVDSFGESQESCPVWLSFSGKVWLSEVPGYAMLTASGESPSAAIESLVDLMTGLWDELRWSATRNSVAVDRLAMFLWRLFGE